MQLNRSTDLTGAMTGEAPGLSSQWPEQDLLGAVTGNGGPVWKNANNNVSLQTGEEFSMKFLQECAASRVVPAGYGVYEERVDRPMVYEELARVLGLGRMDSECGSDITEFTSARGSITQLDHGVYMSNESIHYKDSGANGHKASNSIGLSESDSSKSLYSSGLGVSDGSQSGKIKILCSFGGKVLPRPSDGKLRYVGGDTRMISIQKNISWEELLKKTFEICNQPHSIKYQLPGEDLDALISVSSDEDLQNMIDEYNGVENSEGSQRLRIFLIPMNESETSYSLDASSVQQSDPDYQYVVAVNGIAGVDPLPQNYYNGQPSASEMGHLMLNADQSFEKIFPYPLHPSEIKDDPVFPVELADMKNAKATIYKNNSSHVSVEEVPSVFGAPLPPEDSICVNDSHYHRPNLAVNLMNSHDPIDKHGIIQPNITRQLTMKRENSTSQRLEQHNSNFEIFCQEGVPVMGRTLYSENHPPQPDNLVEIFPGIPHAFSDSKLQEHGQKSAYSSQEGITQSFSLNLERPLSSSYKVSAALLEKPLQLHENIGLMKSQLHTKALNAEPTIPVSGVAFPNSPICSEALSKFEVLHKDVSFSVGKDHLAKEDLRNHSSTLKTHENEFISTFETMNKDDANSHLLSSGENFCISKSPLAAHELVKGTENVNIEPLSHIWLDSSKQEPEVFSGLAPSPSCVNLTPLIDTNMEQSQKNHFSKTSTGVTEGPTSVLNGLPNDLVSPQVILSQPFGGSRDSGRQEVRVRGHEDLDRPTDDHNASMGNIAHNSALLRREVSLLDDDLPNYADLSNQHQQLEYGLLINNIKQRQQISVPVVQCTGSNLSTTGFPSSTVQDASDAADVEILSPCATKAESALQNMDFEGINAVGREDELFSDAMIAEMEADIYGLQIIKNADLEELRELGAGTYGTVYYGKWRGTDVAIKRLKKACFSGRSSEQERLTKDFWREARILSNLHHPNVVAFYGVVPDGSRGTLATVTEFMANGSLRTALIKKEKLLDQHKKLIIAMDAAFGMEYLHSKNIVHFDLKCDNLLVNLRDPQRPICKVGDFGLSKIKRNTLVSGGVRGTLPWMAPELLNGSTTRVSEKVDVFSFGIALWEILTGEEPYANMHCGAIIGGIVKNTLRPPIPEWCDPEWRKLMEQCWSADPQSRPSFTEITYKLRSISASLQAKGQTNMVRQLKPNISK
ncbi:hypothetical protein BUALT_Bualt13G0028500 [Buddleja alternifolia]|uniref:Protein kinase domain-containing protein n=1 Tax=Buddleja alternifolia TaxID=168488 RepID=A0AAV6WR02_9LAMI|nr:hypothetical protein BUALT_Bualt13G0028500 [Buddleja alternifolia]